MSGTLGIGAGIRYLKLRGPSDSKWANHNRLSVLVQAVYGRMLSGSTKLRIIKSLILGQNMMPL